MTMFAAEIPTMPQPMLDLAAANPEGFAEAMGSGMEAMTAAIEGGASPADAFDAMGDAMSPMMEEMGVSPEAFDAMGDAFGATMGPPMHMAPADATGGDMGAMIQDGLDMMMPEGVVVPPVIMDAMGELGSAMGDAGMGCHDVGAAMMGDPGSDTYMLPIDADGNAVVEPGQPETCPADACQAPPADGACASTDMMPPVVGYDHAPMQDEFVMPEPFDMATATNVSEGLNPDGTMGGDTGGMAGGSGTMGGDTGGMAGGSGTMGGDTGGMAGGSGGLSALSGAVGGSGTMGGGTGGMAGGSGGLSALGDALSGGGTTEIADNSGPDQNDVAVGAAMDSATEQGSGQGSAAGQGQGFGEAGEGEEVNDSQEVDPSAGMG
jgi:hypothetical protein